MQRNNNFNNPIVDVILTIGFADYNPFSNEEIRGRFAYILDHYEETPIDQMSIGDYIEMLNQRAENLYAQHFEGDSYKKYFCYEVMADESFYQLRLAIVMDYYDEDLAESCVELYDSEEEDYEDD